MKMTHRTTNLGNSNLTKLVVRRRAALMLAIGGVTGLISPSFRALAVGRTGGDAKSLAVPILNNETGLRNATTKLANRFQSLKMVGTEHRVVAVHHARGTYKVTTADGRSADFLEANLHFKIDSSVTGPSPGHPVILPSGTIGDRASVFVASPSEISALISVRVDA